METIQSKNKRKFMQEEMETFISRSYGSKTWSVSTNNPSDMKRFQAKNFPIIKQVIYEDGTPEYMIFEVPLNAIILKNQAKTEAEKEVAQKRREWAIQQNAKQEG